MWLKLVKSKFDPEAIELANKTNRSQGAIGPNATIPKLVSELAHKDDKILDFGAGRHALHAKLLKEQGLDVSAHEFGENQNQSHDPDALTRQFNIVYASNVANVQSSIEMLRITLSQIYESVAPGGMALINLPGQPRKCEEISADVLRNELEMLFGSVDRIGGSKQAPIFRARKLSE
jgi:hypothetical protein